MIAQELGAEANNGAKKADIADRAEHPIGRRFGSVAELHPLRSRARRRGTTKASNPGQAVYCQVAAPRSRRLRSIGV
jgi:hypothetical protein